GADEFGTPPVEPGICEITLYWNGTSWGDENGDPVIFDDEEITEPNRDFLTEIRGAYDTEIHGSFSTCELTIATGGSLRVAEDDYVFIVNRLINNLSVSAVIVENNGSIVQETDFNENIGEITYKRKAMPMYNFDYTYWGSPVTGQTTSALSPNSGGNMFAWNPEVYYDTTYEIYLQRRWGDENNSYVSYTGVMEPGHGYIIKAPNNFPNNTNINPSVFTANFKGVPNSGPYNIATTGDPGNQLNGNPAQNPASGYPHGDYAWNLFSNPYPSAIDIDKFRIANNQTLGDNVYLWSHNTKPVPGQTYYQYVANDFAVYNAKLGQSTCATPFPQGSITPNPNYNHPTRFIAAGQGFFMPAKTGTVQFNNSMRVSTINGNPNSIMPNNQFFKVQDSSNSSDQGGEEIHNIKLSIRNEQNAFHQMLLGYAADASDDLDDVDGILFGGNYVSLYSVIENYHLVVQGRGLPFTETDQVQLGFSLYISGDFSIHLDYFDGLFEEDSQDQDIYLYDSYLDITHDLKAAPYEFTSEEGTFNDRFVLKYMSPLSIGDINNLDNSWAVYQKENQLQITASGFDIKDIAVYDVLGRLVYQKENINTNSHTIEKMNSNQVLIVKVTSTDNTTSVKKVFN
ncbi:MAG: T9SS sorting signal type C domain-containing protein, partial [Flavobacteriaceae bacterium]